MANLEKVVEFLQKAKVFSFLTDDDGQPKGRPFSFVEVRDGRLVFGTGTHKEVYRQLLKNPKVEILATSGGQFLRVDGVIEFFDDPDFLRQVREKYAFMTKLYNEQTGLKQCFFYLNDAHAQLVQATGTRLEEYDVYADS